MRGKAQKVAHMQQVLHVDLGSATKQSRYEKSPLIEFNDNDMQGAENSHNDPLVIIVRLRTFDIIKVLVDPENVRPRVLIRSYNVFMTWVR